MSLIQYPDEPVPYVDPFREEILNLLKRDAYKQGQFTLSSGKTSDHYVNCKPVTLSGEGIALISPMILAMVENKSQAVAGLTLGADPLVVGVAMSAYFADRTLAAIIVRKQAKNHGTQQWLEGPLPEKGAVITVLEDVTTTGQSALQAVTECRNAGYIVERVITIVDRQEDECYNLMSDNDLELHSVFKLEELCK